MLPHVEEDIADTLCRIKCNGFSIFSTKSERSKGTQKSFSSILHPAALALYAKLSLFNHSCFPNCSRLNFDGFLLSDSLNVGEQNQEGNQKYMMGPTKIIALRNIQIGEELTISYVRLAAEWEERRTILLENFYFECNCDRCQQRDPEVISTEISKQFCLNENCFGLSLPIRTPDNQVRYFCNLCKIEK